MKVAVPIACLVAGASLMALPPAFGQGGVDFEIKILEMEPNLADLLEGRLAEGGEKAEAVHAKLPDLVRGGKIREIDTITFRTKSGRRGQDGAELRNADGYPSKEGYFAEHDVVVSADKSGVEANLYFERCEKDRDGAMVARETVTAYSLLSGVAEVVERFDRDGRARVYLAKATVEGAPPAGGAGRERASVRAEIYKMRDAKAAADLAAVGGKEGRAKAVAAGELVYAMGKAVRTGQRVRGHEEIFLPRKRRDPRGVLFDAEVLVGRGQISVSAQVDFAPWEGDAVGGTAEVDGMIENGDFAMANYPGTPYLLAVGAKARGGLIDSAPPAAPVAAKPPAGRDAKALYLAKYAVQPQVFKDLEQNGQGGGAPAGIRPNTRQLLEANGVEFPEGASAYFNPAEATLVVRQDAAGHAAIVELIKKFGP